MLELATQLRVYVDRLAIGRVVVAPFEVELSADSAVQPDVLVLLADRESRLTPARLLGPPSLVVEVISYSSKRTDRLQKRRLYQEEGVPEYWIVDPDERRVERWRPADAEPEVLTTRLVWQPAARIPRPTPHTPRPMQNVECGIDSANPSRSMLPLPFRIPHSA